jgi:hypothetical protein
VGVSANGGISTTNTPGGIGVFANGGNSQSSAGGIGLVVSGGENLSTAVFSPAANIQGTLLMSGGADYIDFGTAGVNAPSDLSNGWKVRLYNNSAGAGQQYGFGINGGELWSVSANMHRWWNTTGSSTAYQSEMKLDGAGNLTIRGSQVSNGTPDLAETIPATSDVGVADVVCADPSHAERVVRCTRHDAAVLGAISDGSSSLLINARGHDVDAKLTGQPLVLAGRVPVKVTLENGPIAIGDFLAPSSTPGVAMRMTDGGMAVGVALSAFDGKKAKSGTVLCFVKVGEHYTAANMRRLEADNAALRARLERLEQTVAALADAAGAGGHSRTIRLARRH